MQISDEMIRVAHAEYHKVLGDKNRSDPMRAALTAALALSGWRTIDSAPKNGTPFLAWESEERGPFKCWMQTDWPRSEVYWTDAADSEPAPKFWKPLDAPPATAGKEG